MTITLVDASKQYLTMLESSGTSARTIYTYGKDFEQIQAFFGPDRALDSISRLQVGKFLKSDELLRMPSGKGRAPSCVKKTKGVLKRFLQWAQAEGLIEDAPIPSTF